ncbi:hypothetical protein PoB_004319400 [Plakobranchus ocellatus]|uniref:Secreted protein n=1 Tax=Plakobranchus ocellatus TaxID=259542 RepID=A0AAV4BD15_9GAST|nr:hypothetical protein PoB_004319400 [Plakobranchus ocellatus]
MQKNSFVDILVLAFHLTRGVGSSVACESALRSAGTPLSRVRAPLLVPWPDGGPESLRSPCCGLAIYKKLKNSIHLTQLLLLSPASPVQYLYVILKFVGLIVIISLFYLSEVSQQCL